MDVDFHIFAVDNLHTRDAALHFEDDVLALVDYDGLELGLNLQVCPFRVLEEDAVLHLDFL